MHELLLQGSIPPSRHSQVLNILAGIAAMQPQAVLEEHQVWKPIRTPASLTAGRAGQVGAAQDVDVGKSQAQMAAAMAGGDLYYWQVVRDMLGSDQINGEGSDQAMVQLHEDGMDLDGADPGSNRTLNGVKSISTSTKDKQAAKYTLQFRDMPEPNRQRDRAVTSRFIADIPITSGDPKSFMQAFEYNYISSYVLEGQRLTHNNISLLLYRIRIKSPGSGSAAGETGVNGNEKQQELTRLLDPSGNYILQATVRVYDGSKIDNMTKGVSELLALKETLKGVVDLDMADRLSLDTRVR